MTHGRGDDFNQEMEANETLNNNGDLNVYQTFGLGITSKGFDSKMPNTKARKMDYTSNQDLDKNRKD